jgi:hypothetical protein
MIHATDGDHDLDEAHYQAFESYRGFPDDVFLGEIVGRFGNRKERTDVRCLLDGLPVISSIS